MKIQGLNSEQSVELVNMPVTGFCLRMSKWIRQEMVKFCVGVGTQLRSMRSTGDYAGLIILMDMSTTLTMLLAYG